MRTVEQDRLQVLRQRQAQTKLTQANNNAVAEGLFTARRKKICHFEESQPKRIGGSPERCIMRRRVSTELATGLIARRMSSKLYSSPLVDRWTKTGNPDAELVFAVKKWDSAVFANNKDVDWQIGALACDFGRRCISVSLTGCVYVSDEGLAFLAERCPNLRKLYVTCAPLISDAGIKSLTEKCPGLEFLYLSENESLTDEAFVHCAKCCRLTRAYLNSDHPQRKANIKQLCRQFSHVRLAK
jgi:hypothetical protein